MSSLIRAFRRDERGVSTVEYALLIVFICIAVAAGVQTFGANLNTWFQTTAGSITTLPNQIP
jgi:Flp pilus assembly pilin Flp